MSQEIRNSKRFLGYARNDKDGSSDFGEDRFRRQLARARPSQLRGNFVECGNHLPSRNWIIEQTQDRLREISRFRAMLDEFRNNFSVSEYIGHPEISYFHKEPAGKISRPGNFIDEGEWHSKISRFQSRASRSHNSNICPLHDFGRLTQLYLEQMSIL